MHTAANDGHRSIEIRRARSRSLVVSERLRAFAARSPTLLLGQVGVFTNLRLVAMVVASLFLRLALHQIQRLIGLFHLPEMSLVDRGLPLLLGLIPATALELTKLARRRV
jgi:hypothetical protein